MRPRRARSSSLPGELDLPELTFPLHLRLCEDCLLLQIPAVITPEDIIHRILMFFVVFREPGAAREVVRQSSGQAARACQPSHLWSKLPVMTAICSNMSSPQAYPASESSRRQMSASLLASVVCRRSRRFSTSRWRASARGIRLGGFGRSEQCLRAHTGSTWFHPIAAQAARRRGLAEHRGTPCVKAGTRGPVRHDSPRTLQYYTLLSATRALATAGLAVVDAELLPTHGGSLRIWARPARIAAPPTERVVDLLRIEKAAGLHRVDGYLQLRRTHRDAAPNLLRFLLQCRADGKRVVGYGAPGKGNTLLNYCGIRSDLVEYIVDRNPYKHGRFTPGMRIPIRDPERIAKDRPDVVLALPWNLETELTDQLSYIAEWGGQLVFPPTLQRPAMLASNGNGAKLHENLSRVWWH